MKKYYDINKNEYYPDIALKIVEASGTENEVKVITMLRREGNCISIEKARALAQNVQKYITHSNDVDIFDLRPKYFDLEADSYYADVAYEIAKDSKDKSLIQAIGLIRRTGAVVSISEAKRLAAIYEKNFKKKVDIFNLEKVKV